MFAATRRPASSICPPSDNLHVDGIYGSLTQESVEDAQQYYGAHVDGVFGPQTSSDMSWPLAGNPGVCGFWS
jgi:peptidoglycan hydrolase-like protein with peptidoglycan-binding domain